MAKIRTLKAEFFRNADVSRAGFVAKTLAAGLVCTIADDDGRFKVATDTIRAEVFTHDAISVDDVEVALGRLAAVDFVRLYSVHGRAYGVLPTWKEHQKVPPSRYKSSSLPAPPTRKYAQRNSKNRMHSAGVDLASEAGMEGNGLEGKGEEQSAGESAVDLTLTAPVSLTPIEQVFQAWQARWHPAAKLTPERRAKIQARLREGWSIQDLIEAVTEGAANDPWTERHLALNDDLTHVLRNGGAVEKFLDFARRPGSVLPPTKRTLAQSYREQAAVLREAGD